MRVVSNTSPISNLAIIGRLEILREQFGMVSVPEAVERELAALDHAAGKAAIERAKSAGWLLVERVDDSALVQILEVSLDAGESEAIGLAAQNRVDLLIMDESAGRAAARRLEIPVAGTLGLLLKEKQCGRIPSLKAEIDSLVSDAGFYLSSSVTEVFLKKAGEET